MTQSNYPPLTTVAAQAAREAGALLAARSADLTVVDAATRRDVKLAADRAAEEIILDHLRETGIDILSEEAGEVGDNQTNLRWVVDPLDGTVNFSRNLPLSCVSIALLDGGHPVAGVVYDFWRDELFTGIRGQGGQVNGRRLQVTTETEPNRSVLATGLPPMADFSNAAMQTFGASLSHWQKIRMLGSAALSLAYVAAGRIDGYWESGIMPWDVAAGVALVIAAGGEVEMSGPMTGQPIEVRAANPALLRAWPKV